MQFLCVLSRANCLLAELLVSADIKNLARFRYLKRRQNKCKSNGEREREVERKRLMSKFLISTLNLVYLISKEFNV